MGLTLDELCDVTEAYLIDAMGYDEATAFLYRTDEQIIAAQPLPHFEVAAPIPAGISPYFPEAEDLVPLPPNLAALHAAFMMPTVEE